MIDGCKNSNETLTYISTSFCVDETNPLCNILTIRASAEDDSWGVTTFCVGNSCLVECHRHGPRKLSTDSFTERQSSICRNGNVGTVPDS